MSNPNPHGEYGDNSIFWVLFVAIIFALVT